MIPPSSTLGPRAVLALCWFWITTAHTVLFARAACDSVDIRIYQPLSNGSTALLHTGNPIVTDQTVKEFYAYDRKTRSYMGTDLPVAGDTSLVTIHQDSRSCDLALVLVHSARGERGLDQFGDGFVVFYINGDLHNPEVQDDPEFTAYPYHSDEYDSIFFRRRGYVNVGWVWDKDETDGLAQTMTKNFTGCITIDPQFINTFTGLDGLMFGNTIGKWEFVSTSSNSTQETTNLDVESRVYICFKDGDPESNVGENPFPYGGCPLGVLEYPPCGLCERNPCHQHWICNLYRFQRCTLGLDVDPWMLPGPN